MNKANRFMKTDNGRQTIIYPDITHTIAMILNLKYVMDIPSVRCVNDNLYNCLIPANRNKNEPIVINISATIIFSFLLLNILCNHYSCNSIDFYLGKF